MRRTALVSLPVLALAVTGAALAPPSADATSASSSLSFGVPRVVDPIHVYGEPDIAVNPKTGAVHASGPQGTGTQRSIYNISVDGGDSYRILQNLPMNTDKADATGYLPTKSALGPGGGDTEIAIAHNGQAFFNDLAGLVTFTALTTKDDGRTTSVANPLAIPKPLGDRQWMALFDPQPGDHTTSAYKGPLPLNYMEYADQINGDQVATSTDGMDYSHSAGIYANDMVHAPNHGVPLVDQQTGKFLGLTSNTTDADGNGKDLALVVGVPDRNGKLAFHYTPVATKLPGSPETLFPVLAQDGARNLYAVWVDHTTYQVNYSWAPPGTDNEWKTWSKPLVISQAPANVNVFPWVAAGKAPGIIDVAWYGTSKTLKELGADGPSAKLDQSWDLYSSQLDHAGGGAPHVVQVKAAPHPMHFNDICLLGTLCVTGAGNRNQADFFKLAIDPGTGRARIIYTDSSNKLSQAEGTDTAADHQGAALDTVVTQNTGLSALTGKPLVPQESTAPTSSITDPTGDSLFKPLGGTYVPGADITKLQIAKQAGNLIATVTTKAPLAGAAVATGVPTAQIVVRWQMGNVLYFAAAEANAASGATTFYGGKTSSVDLCSVSGCKPNYLTYNAAPAPDVASGTGSSTGNRYVIKIPLSAVGSPTSSSLLEEVMGFVTASPQAGVVPQNNGADFADIAPLQLEGTRTFNARLTELAGRGTAAPVTTRTPGSGSAGPSTGGAASAPAGTDGALSNGSVARGTLAQTGLNTVLPVVAVLLLLGAGLLIRRRRSHDAG